MGNPYFPDSLGTRQLINIFDPANPSNSWTPRLNPTTLQRTPGNVRKYTMTTNGGAVILGQREYPPKEIILNWNQLGYSDYIGLAAMTALSPVAYIDNNNSGYLGVLVIDEAEQIAGYTLNVWSVKASFYAIGPYNGTGTPLASISPPSCSITYFTTGGYIPASTTIYFWASAFTPYGESLPSSVITATTTPGTSTNSINLAWAAPTNSYFRKLRIYWNTTNDSTTATFLTDISASDLQYTTSPSFQVYAPYVAYSTLNPMGYGTAFTGYFAGTLWAQGSSTW